MCFQRWPLDLLLYIRFWHIRLWEGRWTCLETLRSTPSLAALDCSWLVVYNKEACGVHNDVQQCTQAYRGACHPAPRFSSAVVPP